MQVEDVKRKSVVDFLKSVRFQICLLLFTCMFCLMFANLSMSVAILSMVNASFTPCVYVLRNSTTWGCERADHSASGDHYLDKDDNTNWSAETQGLVLSSISLGRLFSPVMSYAISKTDVSTFLPVGVTVAALATALIPISTNVGYGLVMAWRVIVGLADAAVQPAICHLLANHFSPKTRSNAYGWTSAGRQFGVLTVYPVASLVSDLNGSNEGWPFIFYISCMLCVLWVAVWTSFLFLQKRGMDKRNSITSISSTSSIKSMISRMDEDQRGICWRTVLTSGRFWINTCAILCHEVPLNMTMMFLPMYMRDTLHFCLRTNGVLSTLPIISFMVTKILATQLDATIKSVYRPSATCAAKWFNFVASLGMGSFLIGVSVLDCSSRVLAVVLLCCGVGFAGFHTPGCIGTVMSLSPVHSSTISSLVFVLISLTSIASPIVVKSIVTTASFYQWQLVWRICAAISLLPTVFFTLFGTAEEQQWSKAERLPAVERF